MSCNADNEYVVIGPQSFGLAVREMRARSGLTQAELAEASGMHRSHLSSIERGAYTQALLRLIEAYRVLGAEVVVRPNGSGPGGGEA
ncbi:MAG: helix-turn-helix transcriptional regulator [Acidimicrobiales bacterium]